MADAAFGKALRKCRINAKKTLKDVADFLGVSIPYVSDVELGRRQPFSSKDINRLAEFLGCCNERGQLLILAVKDRGEITLNPRNDQERELLVALDRRMDKLDDETLKRIRALLDEQKE